MKKLAAILCLSALTSGVFAQGLVSFANGPTTQISSGPSGSAAAFPASAVGSWIFGLLISSNAAGPFTFTGVYSTNTAGAGRLGPSAYQPAVTGWTPQTTMFIEVAGWSANLGFLFKTGWLNSTATAMTSPTASIWGTGLNEFFGLSGTANIASGGGSPPAPATPLFGGTGLSGFDMVPVGAVPEPSSMALAGLGAAALLILRRRK